MSGQTESMHAGGSAAPEQPHVGCPGEIVDIWVAHEERAAAVAEVIRPLLEATPQALWCEPQPQRDRVPYFLGLWTPGTGNSPSGQLLEAIVLEEARLYWPDGWVHVAACGDQTRLAAFRPVTSGASLEAMPRPAWCATLADASGWDNPAPLQQLTCRMRNVLTIRDLRRYALEHFQGRLPDNLQAIEFYNGTELVLWKLEL